MKRLDMAGLKRMIDLVDAGVAVLATRPKLDEVYEDCRAHQRAAEAILNSLQNEHGATWSAGGAGFTLRLAGIKTSCTGGANGLLTNWLAGARKRLAEASEDRP